MAIQQHKEQSWSDTINGISRIFCAYRVEDVAISLFVSNIWLPNIASPVQHQFLTAIFASLKAHQFRSKKKISTYNEFAAFLKQVYALVPSFPELEDYVPESDWGDVKFHHDETNYRIFYGCEIGNIYDWLMLFQMMYSSLDKKYSQHSKRSPASELQKCLNLQNDIITGITQQPSREQLNNLSPGHVEIPSESFWAEAYSFYSNYVPEEKVDKSFLDIYSADLGTVDIGIGEMSEFYTRVWSGSILPFFFVKHGDRYFPISPRRYSSILLDSWSNVFDSCYKQIDEKNSYSLHLNSQICFFLRKRIDRKYFFPIISPVDENGKPHEVLFAASFISRDRLMLAYVLPPFCSAEGAEKSLQEIAPKLDKAIEMIAGPPVRFGLNIDRKIAQFKARSDGSVLTPLVFIVLPQATTQIESIEIPISLSNTIIISLDQFLAIMDEVDKPDEIAVFLEYLGEINEATSFPLIGLLDKYASFKDSSGVLVAGARKPDLIMLYPHWGSNHRYESLAKFWSLFPPTDFFDHPRSWKLEQETPTRVRLTARGYFGCAIYYKVGTCCCFTNAPFDHMTFEQGQLANLLMESIEDSMSGNRTVIEKHRLFSTYNQSQVSFFPQTLVVGNEDFKHLRHLNLQNSLWRSDIGFVQPGVPGVRVVFNDELLVNALQEANDRTIEVGLLGEVLTRLDTFARDPILDDIIKRLDDQKYHRPRFKVFWMNKEVSFPEFVSEHVPSIYHHKRARKRIAEIASQIGLEPGVYQLEQAKAKLNNLRKQVVKEVEEVVSKHDYKQTIPYLIERIDALNHKHERGNFSLTKSLEHDVDFDREQKFATEYKDYVREHKNFRYVIEKFVQLRPSGNEALNKDGFQYLAALVDKLHEIYTTSDIIHYDIAPVEIHINNDYVINVQYEPDFERMQEAYGKEHAEFNLGLVGNKNDRVNLQEPIGTYLDVLDKAFTKDLGFGARSMLNFLQILSRWSDFRGTAEENSFYAATQEEMTDTCLKNIKGIQPLDVGRIVEFLTLKSTDVIQIINENDEYCTCEDLPVWEYRKRYSRYNLRPLILINDKYYWGPYSARKSGIIWSNILSAQSLPADIRVRCSAIENVIVNAKRDIESALVDKTSEIIERHTKFVEKNVFLHKRDKKGAHPEGLGDYDVLAFWPDKNLILNIEDKDILPAFCPRDAKTIREEIFGHSDTDKGYLGKVEKRAAYLSRHLTKISNFFGWKGDSHRLPTLISIFVSRYSYWWTKFPPRSTDVHFSQIELLDNFLSAL